MSTGNPYHDEKGRFCSGAGAVRLSSKQIRDFAESEAERWQDDNSEVEYDIDMGTGARYSKDYDYDDVMEIELSEKADDLESEVSDVYNAQVKGLYGEVREMDYETLKDFVNNPEKYSDSVADSISCGEDLYSPEDITGRATEDFLNSDIPNNRYARIVAKCNGHLNLFAMAEDEKNDCGIGPDYATQKIKRLGLEKEYANYCRANEAYEPNSGKYKSRKAYLMAEMKRYRGEGK